jgi:hypothetical protein
MLRRGIAISLLGAFAGSALGCGGGGTGASGGGQGGGGQGGGGQGGADSCPLVKGESFGFSVTTADGISHGCPGQVENSEIAIEGQVTAASSTDDWVIDTCPPTADCAPTLVHVQVNGEGPKLDIPVGALVSVATDVSYVGGTCHSSLLITNLPSWEGLPNPVATDAAPWFQVGGDSASPFDVETIEQCHSDGGCMRAYYKLRFMLKDDPSVTTAPLAMGEGATLDVPSGAAKGSYLTHNVYADSGYCEIAGSIIFWIRRAP